MEDNKVFFIENEEDFVRESLGVFHFQYHQNKVYREYCDAIGCNLSAVNHYRMIPFLPVRFFKTHTVISGDREPKKVFLSSGTSGMERSRHAVADLSVYLLSLQRGFETLYGDLKQYEIFALMPTPIENPDSSLVFMVAEWISLSDSPRTGFYLNDFSALALRLAERIPGKKKILIGLTYALLDFAEAFPIAIPDVIIMETGGMKGKRKEMIPEELHEHLKRTFNTKLIHSEYGMSELLSQAYSRGDGRFESPPWMRVLVRDIHDPLGAVPEGKTGGLNIIDLANYNSCSFIATQDLGKTYPDGSFEVLGRFDDSDIRGCNLMIG